MASIKQLESKQITITHSSDYRKFWNPIVIEGRALQNFESIGKGVQSYIIDAMGKTMSRLINFVFSNKSLIELAKYLYKYRTRSLKTLSNYVDGIHRFCLFINKEPDELIEEVIEHDSSVNEKKLKEHIKLLDNYVEKLSEDGLAPGTILRACSAVKALYASHGIKISLPHPLPSRTIYKDRAPRPEELVKVLEIADLRGKVIVSMLALGGFRIGTLARLRYRHVKYDLERGIIPIHIHVEASITKGKYSDYDTFIGAEASEYLRLYLEQRKIGTEDIPPEEIHDESPLIRDEHSKEPKPITAKRIYWIVHELYRRAGLIKKGVGRRNSVCVHSLRKYFKTQLTALGVPSDYIEYMMGHKISTYEDVQMKGIDFLRNLYRASGLAIRPKTTLNKVEMLKTIVKSLGLDPERVLIMEALQEPHRTIMGAEEEEERVLRETLREALRKEILNLRIQA